MKNLILLVILSLFALPVAGLAGEKLQIENTQFDLKAASTNYCNSPSILGETRDISYGGHNAYNVGNVKIDLYELVEYFDGTKKTEFKETIYSDNNGDFKFCDLHGWATYTLKARKNRYTVVNQIVEMPGSSETEKVSGIILGFYLKKLTPKRNCSIEGYVYDYTYKEHISNVKITVEGIKSKFKKSTISEADGSFSLYYLKPDTYKLTAVKNGINYKKKISLKNNTTYFFYIMWD